MWPNNFWIIFFFSVWWICLPTVLCCPLRIVYLWLTAVRPVIAPLLKTFTEVLCFELSSLWIILNCDVTKSHPIQCQFEFVKRKQSHGTMGPSWVLLKVVTDDDMVLLLLARMFWKCVTCSDLMFWYSPDLIPTSLAESQIVKLMHMNKFLDLCHVFILLLVDRHVEYRASQTDVTTF
jgi:hypothetical protein